MPGSRQERNLGTADPMEEMASGTSSHRVPFLITIAGMRTILGVLLYPLVYRTPKGL